MDDVTEIDQQGMGGWISSYDGVVKGNFTEKPGFELIPDAKKGPTWEDGGEVVLGKSRDELSYMRKVSK